MNFIKFSAIKTLVIINSKFHKICFAEADNHLFMRFSNIIDYLSLRIRRNLVSNQNSQFGGALFKFLPNFWCADEIDQNILSQNNWPDRHLCIFWAKIDSFDLTWGVNFNAAYEIVVFRFANFELLDIRQFWQLFKV